MNCSQCGYLIIANCFVVIRYEISSLAVSLANSSLRGSYLLLFMPVFKGRKERNWKNSNIQIQLTKSTTRWGNTSYLAKGEEKKMRGTWEEAFWLLPSKDPKCFNTFCSVASRTQRRQLLWLTLSFRRWRRERSLSLLHLLETLCSRQQSD